MSDVWHGGKGSKDRRDIKKFGEGIDLVDFSKKYLYLIEDDTRKTLEKWMTYTEMCEYKRTHPTSKIIEL